jgi:hypothetical protein
MTAQTTALDVAEDHGPVDPADTWDGMPEEERQEIRDAVARFRATSSKPCPPHVPACRTLVDNTADAPGAQTKDAGLVAASIEPVLLKTQVAGATIVTEWRHHPTSSSCYHVFDLERLDETERTFAAEQAADALAYHAEIAARRRQRPAIERQPAAVQFAAAFALAFLSCLPPAPDAYRTPTADERRAAASRRHADEWPEGGAVRWEPTKTERRQARNARLWFEPRRW